MADFYINSVTWVVDYLHDGRRRRKYEVIRTDQDARSLMTVKLADLYGARAKLESVRPATEDEERAFFRGDGPKNSFCPISHVDSGPRGS
jgi:hypothetical protein